ncbi:MAG: S-layer homology domain-containing protein [Firmicutes bacterium]|nr:S-layer homology domain-containing protein [Bacillota bacterium]
MRVGAEWLRKTGLKGKSGAKLVFFAFLIFLLVRGLNHPAVGEAMLAAPFTDVAGHWAAADIELLRTRGIVRGYDDGTFQPEGRVTRAEFTKMLLLALGHGSDVQDLSGVRSRFSDVPADDWSEPYLEAAAEWSLVQGNGAGIFSPGQDIKRVEIAAMLARGLGLGEEKAISLPFSDAGTIPEWGRGFVAAVWRKGLVVGYEDGTFKPMAPTTRGEAAALLGRLMRQLGRAFDLVGEAERVGGPDLVLSVEGQRVAIPIATGAVFFRGGERVSDGALRPLDQVYLVLAGGQAQYVEIRYDDLTGELVGTDPKAGQILLKVKREGAEGGTLWTELTLPLRADTPIFRNGQASELKELQPGDRLYLVLDQSRSEIRVLDATRFDYHGVFGLFSPGSIMFLTDDGALRTMAVAESPVVFLNGKRSEGLTSLKTGDHIGLAVDSQGRVNYVEAER